MAAPLHPHKFTLERRKAIIEDIAKAIPYEYAAEANGIAERTLYTWLERGAEDLDNGVDSDYVVFLQDIKVAERTRMDSHLSKVSVNVDRWQADAWMLERRWWKHYGSNAPLIEVNAKLDKLLQGKDNETESKE